METVHEFISRRLPEIESRQGDAYKNTLLVSFLKKVKKIIETNKNKDEIIEGLQELKEEISQNINSLKRKIDNYNEDPTGYVHHSIDEVSYWFDQWDVEGEKLDLLIQIIIKLKQGDYHQ